MPPFNPDSENPVLTCPNANLNEDGTLDTLDMNYHTYNLSSITSDSNYGTSSFDHVCFNICPTVDESGSNQSYYVENKQCKRCPDPEDGSTDPNDPQDRYRDPPIPGTVQDLMNKGIYGMCSNNPDKDSICSPSNPGEGCMDMGDGHSTPEWYYRQQDANLQQNYIDDINWVNDPPPPANPRSYLWTRSDRGLTDNELLHALGTRVPGTMSYVLPNEYMNGSQPNFEKLRTDINNNRGNLVPCDGTVGWLDSTSCARSDPTEDASGNLTCPTGCELKYPGHSNSTCKSNDSSDLGKCWNGTDYVDVAGTFGPNHIIIEEVYDFWETLYGRLDTVETGSGDSMRAVQTFSELLASVSGDSTFEACVNDKLNTDENDNIIQGQISGYTSLAQFKNSDINYLKRKLRKIVTIKTDEVSECMGLLNLGQSICRTGVADKTLQIGSLIFSIVGNDKIDVLNMDNDERIKLNKMIDELGPLIPQAIKNIIHVSKEYEARICNVPSNTTLLLERVYKDLYDKQTQINFDISPYIDFNSLININGNVKFIKTLVVLLVFAFLFMHFANIVVAFLSRSASATKIN